jgi:hypothetical protein
VQRWSILTFVGLGGRGESERGRTGRPERRQRNQPRSANAESPPRRFDSARRLLAWFPFFPRPPPTPYFSTAVFHQGINEPRQSQEILILLTSFISVASEIMPVQTQTRNQPAPTPDPFGDPNAVRLVPPLPPKVSSKRDAAVDGHRETANSRSQDPHRAKPIRSQTHQNVGSVEHLCVRSSRSVLTITTSSIVAAVVLRLLPAAPYPKTLRQRHLSQKNPSLPSAQARRAPPMRTLSIASILQALARVRTHFCLQ